MTEQRKVAIQVLARDAGNELAARQREIDRLQSEVDSLTERVKVLEVDLCAAGQEINSLEEDYAIARTRLGIYGR